MSCKCIGTTNWWHFLPKWVLLTISFCVYAINFVYYLCLVVYKRPTVIDGPDSKTLHKHERAQFICKIVASSLDHFTNAAWWKDGSPTRLPNKANITLQTFPGNDSSYISSLILKDITKNDEGSYTCYSYYNQTILRSMGIDHAVESNHKSADLKIKEGK